MKQMYSDQIQFRESHYDFVVMQRCLIKDSLIIQNQANLIKVINANRYYRRAALRMLMTYRTGDDWNAEILNQKMDSY